MFGLIVSVHISRLCFLYSGCMLRYMCSVADRSDSARDHHMRVLIGKLESNVVLRSSCSDYSGTFSLILRYLHPYLGTAS